MSIRGPWQNIPTTKRAFSHLLKVVFIRQKSRSDQNSTLWSQSRFTEYWKCLCIYGSQEHCTFNYFDEKMLLVTSKSVQNKLSNNWYPPPANKGKIKLPAKAQIGVLGAWAAPRPLPLSHLVTFSIKVCWGPRRAPDPRPLPQCYFSLVAWQTEISGT